ncbi:DUF2971 domain-containing protein, partial [Methanosarcina sp. Z-7115]
MTEIKYGNNVFYKYRPINKYTDSLLINNELYFNYPDNFNDPFDCKLDCYHKGTLNEWITFFTQRGIHPVEAHNTIREYLKEGIMKQKNDGILLDNTKKNNLALYKDVNGILDIGNKLRPCCFSELRNDILMWSRYAQEHTGICLIFKSVDYGDHCVLPLNSPHYLPFFEVNYTENKPKKVNLMDMSDKEEIIRLMEFMRTKSKKWEYEKERRLLATIYDREGKETINFQKDALAGIIFGLKIEPDAARHIKELVDEYYKGINVKLYRTYEIRGKYEIDFKEIVDFDKYIRLL